MVDDQSQRLSGGRGLEKYWISGRRGRGVPSATADAEPSNMKNLGLQLQLQTEKKKTSSRPVGYRLVIAGGPTQIIIIMHIISKELLCDLKPAPDPAFCPPSNTTNKTCRS